MQKIKRIFPVLAAAVCMLAAVLCILVVQQQALVSRLSFRDQVQGLPVAPFYDQAEDKYYLFLPAYAAPEDIVLSCPGVTLNWGDRILADGGTLAGMDTDTELSLTASSGIIRQRFVLELRQGSQLPTLHIQSEGDILKYLHADKENERDVSVTFLDDTGHILLQDMTAISGRGNGTWDQPKRPYTLRFDQPIDFGPFQQISRLNLLADYSDESKLRNSLVYFGGKELDIPYASDYLYINVYVNGEYLGLYGIVTKQEYTKHIQSDGLQAVFEISTEAKEPGFLTSIYDKWIYVRHGNLTQVQSLVTELESALQAQDWHRVYQLLDIESFARKYAMEEFFANYDLVFASQYFFVDESGQLNCMLPWDYDWTLYSSVTYFNDAQVIDLRAYRYPSWYTALLDSPQFRDAIVDVLETEFTDEYFSRLDSHMAQSILHIGVSRENDILRWKNAPAFSACPVSSGLTELEQFRELFRDYFPQRRTFMISYFQNPDNYCHISFRGEQFGHFFLPRGSQLADYLGDANIIDAVTSDGRVQRWFASENEEPLDIGTVTADIDFMSRYNYAELPDGQQETLLQKLSPYAVQLTIAGIFLLTALTLFLTEARRLLAKERVRT